MIVLRSLVISCISLWLLISCSASNSTQQQAYTLDDYSQLLTTNLLQQLPDNIRYSASKPRIAVSSFVPVNSFSLSQADETEKQMANQLSESMLSHIKQHGYDIYDYRLRDQLALQSDHEQALSRQLTTIANSSLADTLLVGTYSILAEGIMLNTRLITVKNKRVLAASSQLIPADKFWQQQGVIQQGNRLYRRDLTGVKK
ncbi:FlgO family outer membrane protein [Rheinheimera sp. MMS21-TC3]|uniref:FlgO family outer membrane protein n=1 Tax=Rheinheimera sp. MMS21-TC3 TaxID=3072790 RepID=UPI0028C37A96|nr:FlgO family outer membrane protein [Rheinheimera sp. MMS21-TC3]WNO61847.1 FlgO family outer membrane protein [Rheinheimera sp. MMS21-TC3]